MKKLLSLKSLLLLSGIALISSCKSSDDTSNEQSAQLKELQGISAALEPFGKDVSKGINISSTPATDNVQRPEAGELTEDSTNDNNGEEHYYNPCSLLTDDNKIISEGSLEDDTLYKITITVPEAFKDSFCNSYSGKEGVLSYEYSSILEASLPSGNTVTSTASYKVESSSSSTKEGSVIKYKSETTTNTTGKTVVSDGTMNLNIDVEITYSYGYTSSSDGNFEESTDSLTGNFVIYFTYDGKDYTTREILANDIDDEAADVQVKFLEKEGNVEVGYLVISKDGSSISVYDLDKNPVTSI